MQSRRADWVGFPEYAGQYRLEAVLGSGGMGVVHLATSGSGLKLAVKIVHPQHAVDPEFRARFRQEVAAARRVSGAFTAPVVDADPDAERPWMATVFIDAPTLAERVRERVLDAAELTRLAAGLAEALRDIHRAGVVHRDLKPGNVLMAPDGVRVIDFGISRPADSQLRTETGKLIGTPPYMAPEQFQRPREVGPAADVFALGAVLVHAATGRGPFDSDSHYLVAYQVVHGEPDLSGLPERLAPVVARCLAKDPADRPTAEELIAQVRAVAYPTGEDTQAFIPQPRPRPAAEAVGRAGAEDATHVRSRAPEPDAAGGAGTDGGKEGRGALRRWSRRRRGAAAAAVLAASALAAGGVYAAGADGGESLAARTAGRSAPPRQPPAPWAVTPGGTAQGGTGAACAADTAAVYCAGAGLAAVRLDPADGTAVWSVPAAGRSTPGTAQEAPLLAGGLVLTAAPGAGLLQARDPGTGAERWRHPLPGGGRAVAAGGHVLAVSASGTATALDAATGAVRWTRQVGGSGTQWWAGAPEPGGPALYAAVPDGDGSATRVTAVDPATGAGLWQLRTAGQLQPVGAAQGGLFLLDSDLQGRTEAVVRIDLGTRAVKRVRPGTPLYQTQASVGADGVVYAFGASGGLAAIGPVKEQWRLETGLAVASRPVSADGRVFLSAPDGRLLAVDAATGRPLGQTKPRMAPAPNTFTAALPPPVTAAGRVFASAPDGTVFAADPADPSAW
ncbi:MULTISPECIES: protein kinase domain-containing protein [Streptomyces]|uniref:serine/threonine-protein kinase n=1 Tax=Streptomyces TaxID=1883 RepID=UPI0019C19724|nr:MULTISPECIES: serine/threonine-protein kinase [Streptomyces]GGT15944.1 serine/threonine protein kinase [Streptomyces toxytricini]